MQACQPLLILCRSVLSIRILWKTTGQYISLCIIYNKDHFKKVIRMKDKKDKRPLQQSLKCNFKQFE